jgi:dienelactone hydrolase
VLFTGGFLGLCLWRFNSPLDLPMPSGPFGTGRVTYPARRQLNVRLVVWYPINKSDTTTPAPYNPAIAGRLLDGHPDAMEQNLSLVHGHSVAGAAISNARRSFPVLVFWPGYGWQPSRYAILAEQLSSDGYVVVGISPDYRTGSLADTVSARQLVEGWSDEMISVAARLDSLNGDPSQPFAGHLDVTGFGFFGHSIGGAVSLEACSVYPRCTGAIDLDGSVFGSVIPNGSAKPVLFIMGEGYRPPNLPGFRRSRAAFDSSAARDKRTIGSILAHSPNSERVVIWGFRHASFTDEAAFFHPWSSIAVAFGGQTDARQGLAMVSAKVAAYFGGLSSSPFL